MTEIIVLAHNIRSAYNVGSIFRTSDGFGVSKLILSGYTPYPRYAGENRLPHVSQKLTAQIRKSALGAEQLVPFSYQSQPDFASLRRSGFVVAGLEQDGRATKLPDFHPPEKIVLLLGEEVHGLTNELKLECDVLLEIPMLGKKESFNVSVAAGIALYALSI